MGNHRRWKCNRVKKRQQDGGLARALLCKGTTCSGALTGSSTGADIASSSSCFNGNPIPGVAGKKSTEDGKSKPPTTSNGTGSPSPPEGKESLPGRKMVTMSVGNREYRYRCRVDLRYSSGPPRLKSKKRSCAVCGAVSNLSYCGACHKVSYCGKTHQAKHWKDHKIKCFPCSEVSSDDEQFYDQGDLNGPFSGGPYFIATREVERHRIILKEPPLMTGPGCSLAQEYQPLCLGCTIPIKASQKCSKCKWPVCGISCEECSRHTENECDIFQKNGVKELLDPFQYDLVRILRCLLMKKLDPEKYELLIQLCGRADERKTMECLVAATTTACVFIRENCKLVEFDRETIDMICGIVDLQTQVSGPHRTSMQIFTFPSRLAHSCTPNCRLVESLGPKGDHSLMLTAISPITKGSLLTFSLLDIFLPSYQRQSYFLNMYYFTCTCVLCMDEEENGTFFSGVKCTKGGQVLKAECGYLLPKYPTDSYTNWMCTRCDFEADGQQVLCLLNGYDKVDALFREKLKYLPTERILSDIRDRIRGLEKRLHPNNYFVVKNRILMLSYLNQHVQTMDKPKAFNVIERFYNEGVTIAHNLLIFFITFNNGESGVAQLQRGILLYHLFAIHWAFFQWSKVFGRNDRCNQPITADKFDDYAKEAMEIFGLEVTDNARHLIDQILFMKHNFNVIQTRLSSYKT